MSIHRPSRSSGSRSIFRLPPAGLRRRDRQGAAAGAERWPSRGAPATSPSLTAIRAERRPLRAWSAETAIDPSSYRAPPRPR